MPQMQGNKYMEIKANCESMVSPGVVHEVPQDLMLRLLADATFLRYWQDITPLARNEWLCWVEEAKKAETRLKRLDRIKHDLLAGKRRPCCWPGCPHREKGKR